ncbi:hypothetical protein KY495_08695 [Massilia sp. PAMC28688]|uniref:hypothetical protein n=1 Tax=Massilia sp. PAMC28688 TaxID=2861283 RepID=UPI001C635B42|nr:hypothetical protein [Massilia sp. PAMC28688]QYF95214.1 hypothetical protein KY495_08695 [Massilia sp. PAMC28688]
MSLLESFATRLTIFHALPNCRVIVAFNAGNLPVVAERMQRFAMGVVCADNDWETLARRGFSPGLDEAGKAAAILGGGHGLPNMRLHGLERLRAGPVGRAKSPTPGRVKIPHLLTV